MIRVYKNLVYFGNELSVYYAVDGELPKHLTVPMDAIEAYELPHMTWSRIIDKRVKVNLASSACERQPAAESC